MIWGRAERRRRDGIGGKHIKRGRLREQVEEKQEIRSRLDWRLEYLQSSDNITDAMWANMDLLIYLVIIFLNLLKEYTSYSTPSVPRRTSSRPLNPRGNIPDDNYYDDFEGITTDPPRVTKHDQNSEKCDYKICRDMQTPCAELEMATGCLCPGLTSYRKLPNSPTELKVSREGSDVVVRWCAPLSPVNAYNVTVGEAVVQTSGEDRRSAALGNIVHNTNVCVAAVNEVGGNKSCILYQSTGDDVSLTAGLIGGALGFLLLLSLAVLLWRHRATRKTPEVISM